MHYAWPHSKRPGLHLGQGSSLGSPGDTACSSLPAAASPRPLALAEAARGISAGALQRQGREQCVPVAAAHFSPLTPRDNTRLEDPGLPDISIAVPSRGSHSPFSRTLRCPNCTVENGLAVRKKPKNILMLHLTLLLFLQAPSRGIRRRLTAASLLPPAPSPQHSQV